MKITALKTILDNKFSAKVSTVVNDTEKELIDKFGEPTVNVGGSFTGPPAFTEPNSYRKIVHGFPWTFKKDGDADEEAQDKVEVWKEEMEDRLTSEITTLKAKTDDFSGESAVTV